MIWQYTDRTIKRKMPAEFHMFMGGTSLDVVCAVKALGHQAKLLGALGNSSDSAPFNQWLIHQMRSAGISFRPLIVRERTSAADIHISDRNAISLSYKRPILFVPREDILREARRCRPKYAVVTGLGTDLNEIEMARLLWSGEGQCVLNANLNLTRRRKLFERVVSGVDLLIVNHIEAALYLGDSPETMPISKVRSLHKLGPKRLIVTRDLKGAYYSERGGAHFNQPMVDAGPRLDETGAGDCFLGAFIAAELEGKPPREAMRYAACAAGLKVLRSGGANVPSRQEVDALFARP